MKTIKLSRQENAVKDFQEIKQVLDELGVEFFLVGGSALGGYRDNEFMVSGSASIGLGIFETKEGLESLKLENLIADKLVERGFKTEPNLRTIVQVVKLVQTMIYFFILQKYWWTSYMRNGESLDQRHFLPDRPRVNVYLRFPPKFNQLEEIIIKGIKVKVLKPIEEYLTHTYGNWKAPNPGQKTKLWADSEPPFDE